MVGHYARTHARVWVAAEGRAVDFRCLLFKNKSARSPLAFVRNEFEKKCVGNVCVCGA